MNEINTKWNLGNFAVSLTTLVEDEMRDKLAAFGLRFLGQRVSAVDRILGGYDKKGDKQVRKAGWKRTDAAYGTELAGKLAEAFAELELPGEDGVTLAAQAVMTEYVPTAGAPKFVEEKDLCARHEAKGDLEEWLRDAVKWTGKNDDESVRTHGEDDVEMLAAVKAYKIARLREL
jgi:hypothetical protein